MENPPAPEQALQRVRNISRTNGWGVALFAALSAPLALLLGDWVGAGVALAAVVSGAMEIHGSRRLRAGQADGMRWLVRAQLFLLAVILVYATGRLFSFDGEYVASLLTPEMEETFRQAGLEKSQILPLVRMFFLTFYGTVILVSCLYQGGLAWYYRRKTPLVAAALSVPPPAA
jgi:hypothetical protein